MQEPAVRAPAPAPAPAHEKLALGVAGLACGVYLLHSLPAILFPTGLLASVLTLLAGVLLGVAGVAGALALAFFHLTRRAAPGSSGAGTATHLQPSTRMQRSRALHAGSSAATVAGALPPHAIALRGELSGIVYTAPASAWRRDDTVAAWPPTCEPPQPFRAWQASLAQGTLVLRPLAPPPGAKPASPGRGPASTAGRSGEAAAGSQPDAQQGFPAAEGSSPAGPAAATAGAASGGAGAEGAAGLAPAPAPAAKVGIPLEGCTVELVLEGLKGRSEWIRRAPLLVRHPKWNLLEGEPAFYLWADDPASKQQWLYALGWWCQDNERLAAIDAMYRAYCQAMRDRSCLEYAEHASLSEAAAASGGAAEAFGSSSGVGSDAAALPGSTAGQQPGSGSGRRSGWKGWGANKVQTMRRKMQERRGRGGTSTGGDSQDGEPYSSSVAGGGSQGASPLKPSAPASPARPEVGGLSAELQSLDSIIEARWMQSRKIVVPPAISEVVRSRQGSRPPSQVSSPRAIPRPVSASAGAEVAGPLLPASGSMGSSMVGSLPSDAGLITPSLGTSPAIGGGVQPTAGVGSMPRRMDGSPALPAGVLPPGSPLDRPGLSPAPVQPPSGSQQTEQQQQAAGSLGAAPSGAADGAGTAAAAAAAVPPLPGLPEGMPPLLNPDYAVNAFVTRLAFDLLRHPDFQEHLRSRIQRQLSRLQRPDFIQSLEVVGVDAGGAAPTLRNLRALPQPEASIWPQLIFDMRYQGAFTVTIEMKVDIRDAAAWGRLDQALTRLAEGRARGGSTAGSSSRDAVHLPPHAASAPVLHTASGAAAGEQAGEEEEYVGEMDMPGSPDSSASSQAASMGEGAGAAPQQAGGKGAKLAKSRGMFGSMRLSAAKKLRQFAESTAVQIARIPLRLSLTFSLLEGTMCAWLPPPPGNRLFYSFVAPPTLELTARPEMAGRLLKYSYHVARVSHWVEQRMRAAITKNMVFPGGGDLLLVPLMALEHPNAADGLPSLGGYVQAAKAAAAAAAKEQEEREAEAAAAAGAAAAKEQEGRDAEDERRQRGQSNAAEVEAAAGGPKAPSGNGKVVAAAEGTPTVDAAQAPEPSPAGDEVSSLQPAAVAPVAQAAPAAVQEQQASVEQQEDNGGAAVAAGVQLQLPAEAEALPEQREEGGGQHAGQPAVAKQPAELDAAHPLQQQGSPPLTQQLSKQAQQQQQQPPRSSSREELLGEPTLSLLPSLRNTPAVSAAAASPAIEEPALEPAAGVAEGSSSGHIISSHYSGNSRGSAGGEAAVSASEEPEFQGWAPQPAVAPHNGFGSGRASAVGRTRSAADAWDAAMAQESGAVEAPTPRFASQQWQAQPPAPLAAGLGLGLGGSLSPGQQPAPGTSHEAGAGDAAAAAAATPPLPAQRPSLQLKLSATRSLDPDFTTSAEHTGFGEAPPTALPDYSSVRRTLSARSSDGGSHGGATPGSARGSRDAVGAAISRSLASLRRQGSSLKQQQAHEAAAHAGHLLQQQEHGGHQQQQQVGSPQQQQSSPPQQRSPSSPPQEGGSPLPGDPRRLRAPGSLKEHAGKFLTRMNAAGKALASQVQTQVQDMQQQRAAARMARASATRSPGRPSMDRQPEAGASIMHRSPSQQEAL